MNGFQFNRGRVERKILHSKQMYLRVQDPINLNTKIEFIKIDLKLYFKIYLVCFVFAIETIKRNLVVGAFIDDYCKVESDFDFEIKPTGNIVPRLECR